MAGKEKLRVDKYLWAIRVFKTRTLATDACKAGRVKLDGNNVKASHEVKLGEIVGLRGPKGAGKTTSCYQVVGLVNAGSGRV